jgi:hypothetical protein
VGFCAKALVILKISLRITESVYSRGEPEEQKREHGITPSHAVFSNKADSLLRGYPTGSPLWIKIKIKPLIKVGGLPVNTDMLSVMGNLKTIEMVVF